jgi:tetratricopeptide (TPR) repeat protein
VASRRQKIDRRADIYSLGAVLYEMLTFERPFEGNSNQEILKRILVREPASPRRLNPDIPRDLAVIALKAMEKDARHRYRTMADLDHDLRRYLSGDVILARPVGKAERIWKRVKGSPARSIRDILTAAAVFMVVVVAPWMIAQKEREKRMELEAALTTASVDAAPGAGAASAALSDKAPDHGAQPGEVSRRDEKPRPGEEPQTHAAGRAVERVLAAVMMLPTGEEEDAGAARAEALQTAAQMIDESFADQPEIEASLRLTLGRAFYRLGRFEDARRHFSAALVLRRNALGGRDPDTLDAMDDLAALLWEQGDLTGAEELYAELVETRSSVLGASHADTLRSRLNLALVVRELGRDPVSEAEPSEPEPPDAEGRPGPGGDAPDEGLRDLDSSSGFSRMDIRRAAACLHAESE